MIDYILPFLALLFLFLILYRKWYLLPPLSESKSPPCDPLLFIMLFLMSFVVGALGGAVAKFLGDVDLAGDTELSLRDYAALALGTYLAQGVFLIATMNLWKRRSGTCRILKPIKTGSFTIMLLAPLILTVGWVAGEIYGWWRGEPPEIIAHETLALMLAAPHDFWFWVLAGCVIIGAAVCEEVVYREFLQGAFRGWGLGPWPAIVLTSVIFAAMHGSAVAPHAFPALFTLALGLGWAREKTGSLIAPILMHMIFNAGNLTLAMLTNQ